jgi:GH24 family phage-related lysozyme (muramidase)
MRYVVIDGCPCPRPLYPILKKLKAETGCTYNSIYRGDDVAGLLHKVGKHTQRELYDELAPGMANPPDRGTHILRGDGVVGKLFAKLPWWRCGIDVNDGDVDKLIAAARRHGWVLYRAYKTGSEYHHLNFACKPSRWKAFFRNVFSPKKSKPRPHRPTKLSEAGARLIASFEGFRSEPYADAVGVWTIGYGHTFGVGPHTERISKETGLKLLQKDGSTAARAVCDLVDIKLNQNQFDALVSFTFNLGAGALAESTLLKKLNKGNYHGAQREFSKWVYADGQKLPGLVRRRRAEAHLFAKH